MAFVVKYIFTLMHSTIDWIRQTEGTKPNRDIYASQAVKMSSNYWSDCMRIGMATIIKQCTFAIENVQQKLFSLIFDS